MKKGFCAAALMVVLSSPLGLVGCGGGGGGGSSASHPPAPPGYPVRAAFNSQIINGYNFTGKLEEVHRDPPSTGMSNYTYKSTPAVADTFEGQAAQSITVFTATQVIDELVREPSQWISTVYYDSNYNELGTLDNRFGAFTIVTESHSLPIDAHEGDTGPLDSTATYWDRTKTGTPSTSTGSYVIEADTPNSIVLHTTTKYFDADGAWTSTSEQRNRIDTAGNIEFISGDVSMPDGNYSSHLLPD